MNKERFLAFTDAVIAIIATIMVLEFKTPKTGGLTALHQLVIPVLAYTISFFMILTVWYNHHQLYREIKIITPRVFVYNTVWLFVMSFFPFTTAWVGGEPLDFWAELVYICVVILWAGFFHLMERELRKENPNERRQKLTHTVPGPFLFGINLVALIIVWFWPPIGLVSVGILGLAAIYQYLRN